MDVLGGQALPQAELPSLPPPVRRELRAGQGLAVGTNVGNPLSAAYVASCAYAVPLTQLAHALSAPDFSPEVFEALGQHRLGRLGLPAATPLTFTLNGAALQSASHPIALDARCHSGLFWVDRDTLYVSLPEDAARPVEAVELTVSLADAPNVQRSDQKGALHWVYPGSRLLFDVPSEWGGLSAPARLEVQAHPLVWTNPQSPPTVRVGQGPAVPLQGRGGRLSAVLDVPAPDASWTLEITSPSDGPYLALHAIAVQQGDTVRRVAHDGRELGAASVELDSSFFRNDA